MGFEGAAKKGEPAFRQIYRASGVLTGLPER
jgi:hypothetical protein